MLAVAIACLPARMTHREIARWEGGARSTPASVTVKRGETVKFVVVNSGKNLHEMVLGTPEERKAHAELMRKSPNMAHADANMAHVKPGAKGEIVWQFSRAGAYRLAVWTCSQAQAPLIKPLTDATVTMPRTARAREGSTHTTAPVCR